MSLGRCCSPQLHAWRFDMHSVSKPDLIHFAVSPPEASPHMQGESLECRRETNKTPPITHNQSPTTEETIKCLPCFSCKVTVYGATKRPDYKRKTTHHSWNTGLELHLAATLLGTAVQLLIDVNISSAVYLLGC